MNRINLRRPRRKRASRVKKIGLAPGSVVYTGHKEDRKLKIDLMQYDSEEVEEQLDLISSSCLALKKSDKANWFVISGLNNVKEIEGIGHQFKMSLLDVEDLVNTAHGPALNSGDGYLVVIMKLLSYDSNLELNMEHLSLVLFPDSLLLLHEDEEEDFQIVKERIRKSKGKIRNHSTDYLLFALMDYTIDHYFQILETISDKVESLEDQMYFGESQDDITNDIQLLKKEALRIRKAISPLIEITGRLIRMDGNLISEETKTYLKDLQEHVSQIMESMDLNREMIGGLMGMHMTLISNKMNEVMKVLTIISTIFIPLSFIAGVYGMNFEHMPELAYRHGYFILLGIMFILILSMIIYFWKKKWF